MSWYFITNPSPNVRIIIYNPSAKHSLDFAFELYQLQVPVPKASNQRGDVVFMLLFAFYQEDQLCTLVPVTLCPVSVKFWNTGLQCNVEMPQQDNNLVFFIKKRRS